jgi:hypothetical protein
MAGVAASLLDLATALESAGPEEAADLLADVLTEGGVLDGLGDVLAAARDLTMTRLPASQQAEHQKRRELYHQLAVITEDLREHTQELRDASRILRELPRHITPNAPTPAPEPSTAPVTQPEPHAVELPQPAAAPQLRSGEPGKASATVSRFHARERWVPPSLIQDAPAALDAITDILEAGTIPVSASLLLSPVLDPDGGVVDCLSAVLAAASGYAQQRGAAPGLWQALGRAGQEIGDISQDLAGAVSGLAELPDCAPGAARDPARTRPAPPAAAPTPPSASGRRR